MKKSSQVRLESAIIAGGFAATAVAVKPPVKTLPPQQEIWITGSIEGATGNTRQVSITKYC